MSNTILLKRSGTAGKVPTTANLSLGELSVNYTDGRLYTTTGSAIVDLKQNDPITISGDVITSTSTNPSAGSPWSNLSVTLSTVNSNVGQWGGPTQLPYFTINGKGLVTAAGNIALNTVAVTSLSSTGTGNLTVSASTGAITLALPQTGPGAVTVGSTTSIPVITTDVYGRVTALTSSAIATSFTLNGTNGTATVAGGSTLSLAGTYGVTVTVGTEYANIATPQDLRTTASPSFNGITSTGNLVAASGTASTTTTTGALVVAGGAGISGALNIGGALTSTGNINDNGGGLTTSATTAYVFNETATTLYVGSAATTLNIGNTSGTTTIAGVTKHSGNLVAASGTASTNTTTGALVVAGGTGISGALNVGGASALGSTLLVTGVSTLNGNAVAASGTASTSTTTGALVVVGGAGISGNAYITQTYITGLTAATSTTTGALTVAGGAGIAGAVYAGSIFDSGNRVLSTSSGAGNLAISGTAVTLPQTGPGAQTIGGANSVPVITVDNYGRVTALTSSSISTSFTVNGTTGTTTVAGGSTFSYASTNGVVINVGTEYANISTPQDIRTTASPTFAAGTFNGTVVAGTINAGTIGNTGATITGNTVTVSSTANTTGLGTGALIVQYGGASIQEDLYVGGNIYAGNIISETTQILEVLDPLVYLNASNPQTYNYEIGIYSHFGNVPGQPGYQHTGFVRDHATGVWRLFGNVPEPTGGTINFGTAVYDTAYAGALTLANSTTSTSSTTGALQVTGGAGVQGNVVAGGQVQATSGLYSTGAFNGGYSDGTVVDYITNNGRISVGSGDALTFYSGGPAGTQTLSISSTGVAVHAGNVVAASGTSSSSTTTGALVVVGGAGISGAVYAGSVYDSGNRVLSTTSGAGNVTISGTSVTLTATGLGAVTTGAANYTAIITTDAYGRIATIANTAISLPWSQVTNTPTTLAGYGITDALSTSSTIDGGTY